MKMQRGFTVVEAVLVIVILVGCFGWVWNIIKLLEMPTAELSIMLILRAVGILFLPLGAVIGYL